MTAFFAHNRQRFKTVQNQHLNFLKFEAQSEVLQHFKQAHSLVSRLGVKYIFRTGNIFSYILHTNFLGTTNLRTPK